MAIPVGPLFSTQARGRVGDLVFSRRGKTNQMVRQFHKPSGAPTSAQTAQRLIIKDLVALWKTLSQVEKDVYNDAAAESGEAITGFNLFIRVSVAGLSNFFGVREYGT